jgi:Nif-specific regulatory protein
MRYRLGSRLGEGGFGEVYECTDPASGKTYAVKLLRLGSRETGESLLAEFEMLSRLDHPNIIKVHDFGLEPGMCYLVMELVRGCDVTRALSRLFDSDTTSFLTHFTQILDALECLHARGLAHGDLKPSNVLFDESGAPKLVDFGMAALYRDPMTGLKGATFKYAAPEIFEGRGSDGRSDLFALGLVLYESLAGVEIERKDVRLKLDLDRLPENLAWIVKRLTEAEPAERFQTAYDVKRAILEAVGAVKTGEPYRGEAYLLTPQFVGRTTELETLGRLIRAHGGTTPRMVLLRGPAGVGKTRLLSEVGTGCVKEGIHFIDLRDAVREGLQPIVHLRNWLAYSTRTGTEAIQVPTRQCQQLILEIGMLMRDLAGSARVVVCLGDLYDGWPDAPGPVTDLVSSLGRIRTGNLVLLASTDGEVADQQGFQVPQGIELCPLDVSPLGDGDMKAVVRSMLGESEVPDRMLDLLRRISLGKPALARIALDWMIATGRLTRGVGKWIYQDRGDSDFPAEVTAAYGHLLRSLRPFDRRLLAAMAYLSMPCSVPFLRRITRLPEKQINLSLLGLLNLGLIDKVIHGHGVTYIVREWIMAAARRGVRREAAATYLKRAVGILTRSDEPHASALAGIYEALGQHAKALDSAAAASRQAIAAGDRAGAAENASRVVRLLPKVDLEGSKRVDVLTTVGEVMTQAKDFPQAVACFRRALRKSSPEAKSGLLRKIGYTYEAQGDHNSALRYYTKALANARKLDQTGITARVGNDLAWVSMRLGRHDRARRQAGRVIEMLKDTDHYLELAQAYSTLGVSAWTTSKWEDALRFHRRCLELREKAESKAGMARTLNNIGLVLRSMGRWDEAVKAFEKSIEIKKAIEDRTGLAGSHLNLAFVHFEKGDLDRALIEAENAMTEASLVGDNLIYVEASGLTGEIKHTMGDIQTAEGMLKRAVAMSEQTGAASETCVAKRRYADLLLTSGRSDEALKLASEGLTAAKELGSRLEEACCLRTLGLIKGVGDYEKGVDYLKASEDILKELKARFELGRTYLALAHLAKNRDSDASRQAASDALDIFTQIAATHEMRRARGLLAELGLEPAAALGDTRLAMLFRIAKTVNSVLDLDDLLEVILDLAIETTGAERGFIILCEGENLKIVTARNIEKEKMETARELSESVVREVTESGEPIISVDALADPRLRDNRSVVAFNIRSLVAVPLRIKDRVVGAIYEDTRTSVGYFSRDQVEFLMAFADQAAIAMENARLYGELRETKEVLEVENRSLRRHVEGANRIEGMVGISAAMREIFERIYVAKDSEENVLIVGESGSGKEVASRAIHFLGAQKDRPFVAVNCASIPKELLESELFGHEKGAFTGAHRTRMGYFEAAAGGTLLLDEIADMDKPMQAALLRAIETKEFYRLGSSVPRTSRVRIIATTNRNIEEEVQEGRFREDLYFRLNVIRIDMPPLRQRKEDIPALVEHTLTAIARSNGQVMRGISPSAIDVLMKYSWPGNVRELENCMRSAWAASRGGIITPQHLPRRIRDQVGPRGSPGKLDKLVSRLVDTGEFSEEDPLLPKVERRLIRTMVERIGEKKKSAKLLGISKPTLYSKLSGG